MDVLTAAKIFYKCAQQTNIDDSKSKLIDFVKMLADPNAIQNPNAQNMRTAFMSTLVQEVNNTIPNTSYPITLPESKTDAVNMYGLVKVFYTNLTKPIDQTSQITADQKKTQLTNLTLDFQKVLNAWNTYSSKYLKGLIAQLNFDKSKTIQTQQQLFQNRILFWQTFIQKTNDLMTNIQKLVGSPNNLAQSPLQTTPV